MAVKRIYDVDINKRGLFTAVYGIVSDSEFYVDNDLKRYSLWQQFYLYLKQVGFDFVLFYDNTNNYHSYCMDDVTGFLNLKSTSNPASPNRYVARHIKSPFMQNRLSNSKKPTQNDDDTSSMGNRAIQRIEEFGIANIFYRTRVQFNLLDYLKRFLSNKSKKVAFVLKYPDECNFPSEYLTYFKNLNSNYSKDKFESKIILVYNYSNCQAFIEGFRENGVSQKLFFNNYFKDLFIDSSDDSNWILKATNTYLVSLPEKNEIKNLLNLKRFEESINLFHPIPIEKVLQRFSQERKLLQILDRVNLSEIIGNIDSRNAWEKLNALKGIDPIKEQLRKQVALLRRKMNSDINIRVRPHMVFKGSPGTGKTTVAEIYAEILKEEGVLEFGHLVKAKVGDLIGQYVGQTRIKTQKVCDDAKGGILFIDEAYGLLDGENSAAGFGKQAIEVLIQFMENNADALVILAGYTEDIDKLLKEGNKGFTRRFSPSNHIVFNDYEPSVLIEIAEEKLKGFTITDEARKMIHGVIHKKHQLKNSSWGNASEVENLIQDITVELGDNPNHIEVKHIPSNYQALVNPKALNGLSKELNGFQEINSMIGLQNMKKTLNKILISIKADKIREERLGNNQQTSYKLNFVFRGNPGTGKTTVARYLGEILCGYGLLSKPIVVECRREDIVAKYVGHTADNVKQLFERAIGGVLFFDEIYSLNDENGGGSFGNEAIATIVGLMTDPRYCGKMAFVIAGYPKETDLFISKNPGLSRRFNHYVDFEDYSNEQLWDIFLKISADSGFKITEGCKSKAIKWFEHLPRVRSFENAGYSEKLFELTKNSLDLRITEAPPEEIDEDDLLYTITENDFPEITETNCAIHPRNNCITQNNPLKISIRRTSIDTTQSIEDIMNNSVGIIKSETSVGTGFIISKEGYILTAYHVIEKGNAFTFSTNGENITYKAQLVWTNETTDMAILKINPISQLMPLEITILSNDQGPKPLQEVFLVGYPLGGMLASTPHITEDKISNFGSSVKVNETMCFDSIYTYNNATEGYSGGPLIRKSDLKVIGVLHGGLPENGNVNFSSDIRQLFTHKDLIIDTNESEH